MSKMKVGDKVKVTKAWATDGSYKNGDLLEVIALSKFNTGGIWVRTKKPATHGTAGCDRKIQEPYAYLSVDEYETVSGFEVGDKVKLKSGYYNHPDFKRLTRKMRKTVASHEGKTLTVTADHHPQCVMVNFLFSVIPRELLRPITASERVAHEVGQTCISAGELFTDAIISSPVKKQPKPGDLFKVHVEPYEAKRQWTDKEIAEAQRIIGEIVTNFRHHEYAYISERKEFIEVRYTASLLDGYHSFLGKPSTLDEYNKYVGAMVALCKAVGRKLPEWVKR